MAFDSKTHIFGVRDCKIAKLTGESGSSPTYDTSKDVPGIQEIAVKFSIAEKELRGDDQVLDVRTAIESIEVSATHAIVSEEAMAVILGGSTTSSGSSPNKVETYNLAGDDRPNYFKIEAQVVEVDEVGADLHFICYKCKVKDFELGAKGDDYRTVSFAAKAIPCLTTDKAFYKLEANETAKPIT